MLLLKACPHCHGDLVFEQDRASGYFTCVQCGHILSTDEEHALGFRVTALGPLHACAEIASHAAPASNARLPRHFCAGGSWRRAPQKTPPCEDAGLMISPVRRVLLSHSGRLTRQRRV